MIRAPAADMMFQTPEAAAFRSATLAGCSLLDVDELNVLGDEVHACARARYRRRQSFSAYGSIGREAMDGPPIFDRRL